MKIFVCNHFKKTQAYFVCAGVFVSLVLGNTFDFTAFAQELKTYAEQQAVAKRAVDTFNANYGKIRTLSGDMKIIVKKYDIEDDKKLLSHYESNCTYIIDMVKKNVFLINSPATSLSFSEGKKKDSPLLRHAMIWHDGCFYFSLTTSFMENSTHPDAGKNFARQLQIRSSPDHTMMLYFPLNKWTPSSNINEVSDYYKQISEKVDDRQKVSELMEKRNISLEEAERIWSDWKINGVPGIDFELNEGILVSTQSSRDNVVRFVVDLNKGAMITAFDNEWTNENGSKKWKCELEQVSGVWVPKSIHSELHRPGLEIEISEYIFSDQKVNFTINPKDFSPVKLGVRHIPVLHDKNIRRHHC